MSSKKRKAPDDLGQPKRVLQAHSVPQSGDQSRDVTTADAHFRHLYDKEIDFKQLAEKDIDFASVLQENGQLDFTNPKAVMQLTKTLLSLGFGLKLELPDDRLCPPVPNRHNYILWLKDLMDTSSYDPPDRPVCGLDIGTGASCIYPLLGIAQRPSWSFVATDIDEKSLQYAGRNVALNNFEERILLLQRQPEDPLIPLRGRDSEKVSRIDFTMMNPPFYESEDEMMSSAQSKARPPHSACTGAPVEMVCDGGEVAHVGRMLEESLVLKEEVHWYTSMLGKASSVEILVEKLKSYNIDNYAITEFIQGSKTRRWALGWSFRAMRPSEHTARVKAAGWKKVSPPVLTIEVLSLPSDRPVDPIITRINEVMGSLELMSWSWGAEAAKGTGRTRENVWSRAWRRKKMREQSTASSMTGPTASVSSSGQCRLGFDVALNTGVSTRTVSVHWREGHDAVMFESFAGFLQGRMKDLL
ncbi:hypothetical protein QBC40DRAFT_65449 [Triangularia verruculosa]|uniref:U6 small nuclear RNA (adenine-(43)-N(6))-methyltransferase n=1 Tax=Triangularia verruculosa TaxID=2587418 RepID=A0AAN7B084_9PEZI|nr:hypothetical protein QBC40DRAFT_65449 [Triangularia verruculosa]